MIDSYDRLRQIGIVDHTAAEGIVERITRTPTDNRKWSYRDRRKELLFAPLDQDTDRLDKAADEIGHFFDYLRQLGIRGFIAEQANDSDYTRARRKPGDSRGTATSRLDARPPDGHEPGEE